METSIFKYGELPEFNKFSPESINKQFPVVVSLVDKLAKKNIIHANKAANIKSKLARFVASL